VVDKHILYGVFDGHGGDQVAKLCAEKFSKELQKELKLTPEPSIAIRTAFSKLDQHAAQLCPTTAGATVAIAVPLGNRLWFANCGDALSMVRLKNGSTLLTSQEHKVEMEADRIRKLGGLITYDDGCARINRLLNVGRSIGDHHLKQFVISTPYITSIPLAAVEYFLIGTDGLWDVYTKDGLRTEIAELQEQLSKSNVDAKACVDIKARTLVERALLKGSMDNITVLYTELDTK